MTSVMGGFTQGLRDGGRSVNGTAHFIHEGELWLVTRSPQGQPVVRSRALPAGALEPFTQVMVRDGVFYKGTDRAFLRAVDGAGWKTLLTWKEPVAGVDVDADGHPILLGTAQNLLEVHEPGSQKPLHVEPYPEEEGTPGDRTYLRHCFRSAVVTCQVEELRVIYFPDTGRLYSFDTVARKLRVLRTPWAPLQTQGLQARATQAGGIVLDGIPSPSCLQLVPLTDGTLGIGYQVIRQTATLAQDPVKGLLLDRRQDRSGEFVHWVEVDLHSGDMTDMKAYPDLQLPIWKDPLHGVVALKPWRDAFSRGMSPVKVIPGK